MRARITPLRVVIGLVVALLATVIILLRIPSGDTLLLPDGAHPVAPLVHVQGAKPSRVPGNLYFVDVVEQDASEFDKLFNSWLHPHSTLIPTSDLVPPGSTNAGFIAAELRQMRMSQQVAAAVALRHAGYKVIVHPNGVLVNQIYLGTDAAGKLQPTDIIVSVNGKPTPTLADLRTIMSTVKPGQTVTLRIRRGKTMLTKRIKTTNHGGTALIGFEAADSDTIKLPVKVTIDAGNIGGPSAGLAFTLEVLRRLGENVTHGYRIAATGAINLDGTVSAIGGVKQKTWGARDAGAQVFLVPVDGGNAKDAKKYAGSDLKIIPVTSLDQALAALAALPKLK